MTDQELERRLARAMDHAAPDDLEGVLSRCTERKGTVISMKNAKNKGKKWMAIAACLALLLVGGGGGMIWGQANAVTSVISLDVNPSIQLELDKNGRVDSCQALNEDAEIVLAEMDGGDDLEDATLEVAANALVGALVRHGYLDSISSAILLTVEDADTQRAQSIEQQLTAAMDAALQTEAPATAVLTQTLTPDKDMDRLAEENNISAGKAALVNQVLAKNPALDFAALSRLTVEELRDLSEMDAPRMPIGREAALLAVLEYAGASRDYQIDAEVDPELDDDPACYEVELYHYSLGELEYEVDAYTGAILEGQKDALKGLPGNPNRISEQQAVTAALAAANVKKSEVTALLTDLDADDDGVRWEVEFYSGGMKYEVEVDALTGKVLELDKDQDDLGVIGGAEGATAVITDNSKAKQTALHHAGLTESQVDYIRTDVDHEDGREVVQVEFCCDGWEYEYKIDSRSGKILDHDRDCHDDHGCQNGGHHGGHCKN